MERYKKSRLAIILLILYVLIFQNKIIYNVLWFCSYNIL